MKPVMTRGQNIADSFSNCYRQNENTGHSFSSFLYSCFHSRLNILSIMRDTLQFITLKIAGSLTIVSWGDGGDGATHASNVGRYSSFYMPCHAQPRYENVHCHVLFIPSWNWFIFPISTHCKSTMSPFYILFLRICLSFSFQRYSLFI